MARIAGVNLPNQKRLEIGLTYIYGIGQSTAQKICKDLELDPDQKVKDLTDDEVTKLRTLHRRERRGRGRPAPRALAGDQAPVRDRLLPRRPAPARPARQRAAHEDERAHAQGPEEDRRTRKEGEVVAPPRKAATARGRTRRRVKKNIAIGQAHIKTSFNNTIVSLTDRDGNVIAWSPPAPPVSRARASRPRSPPRSRPTTAPARAWSTACRRSRSSSRARLRARDGDPLAPGRGPRDPRRQGRLAAGPQRRPPEEAEARLVARDLGPKCRVCRRRDQALPQGRALPDGEVRHRAPLLSAGRARSRPHQAERVPAAAAREAEGAPLLRPAREAVPEHLREGVARHRRSGREPVAHARDASRQRRLPARLRRLARPGAPARPPRPLSGERPPGQHPELRRAPERRDHAQAGQPGRSRSSATPPISRRPSRPGCRPTTRASPARCCVARARRNRHPCSGIADRRAVLQVTADAEEENEK